MNQRFLGECIGVGLRDRHLVRGDKADTGRHQLIVVMVEDDESWHEKMCVSSAWLDEFIAQLQAAKAYLDANCERGRYGYERREG